MSAQAARQEGGRSIAAIGTAGVVVLALLAWGLSGLLNGNSGQARKPPKVKLLASPPPPPPPPRLEKKPEPPKEQKEARVEQRVIKQDSPPPSPELKMEGPAGNAPSAFAAGKVTSEDLSKLGMGKAGDGTSGMNGMFSPFNSYANLLKGEFQRYLSKNNALRRRHYAVELRVWVAGAGTLNRFELIGSAGDSETDDAIRQAISSLKSFSQAPPANMPQPIRLRIVTGT